MSAGNVNSSTADWVRSSSESSTPQPSSNRRPGVMRSETSVSNASASQVFTKWLMKKHQEKSGGGSFENDSAGQQQRGPPTSSVGPVTSARGQLFPARLALALGMAKTLLGVLLVAFGALALWEQASMSYLGSGELSSYGGISSFLSSPANWKTMGSSS